MFIEGVGTAVPPRRYSQRECYAALEASALFSTLGSRSQALLRKVLCGQNGIETRHLALAKLEDAFRVDPDTLQERFATHAPQLAAEAARHAIEAAHITAAEIDGLVISTCTGYLCPGLTSYVSELLDLPRTVNALDLVGQGCGASIPNLRTGMALLGSGQCSRVLSICVEVCSAAFYLDSDPGVLISACLFGDGAGAAVLGKAPGGNGRARVRWRASGSHTEPADRDILRFEHRQGMLRNVLSPEVPRVAGGHARRLFQALANREQVDPRHVCQWLFHPGGRDVLSALAQEFQLPGEVMESSARVLSEYGNLSSASLYFVLQETLRRSPRSGLWWMSSFGAGFSCHGALLEVDL
jgi:alkylresorcinol/alkylpyrone synthase